MDLHSCFYTTEHILTQEIKQNNISKKYLFKSRNTTGKYILSIISEELFESPNIRTSYKYFPFPGILEDNDGTTNFSLSLREDYISKIDSLYFKLHDITTDKRMTCPMNFIPSLEENNLYNIKFSYKD